MTSRWKTRPARYTMMASMITGIKDSVSDIIMKSGPNTFYVMRYFRAGIQISDGSDEMSPWRRRPPMSMG